MDSKNEVEPAPRLEDVQGEDNEACGKFTPEKRVEIFLQDGRKESESMDGRNDTNVGGGSIPSSPGYRPGQMSKLWGHIVTIYYAR